MKYVTILICQEPLQDRHFMSEGYIVRYKSRGTFVNQQSKENVFFKEIISFNDEMKMYGFEPKTELISIEKFICNDYIAEKSEFNVGD